MASNPILLPAVRQQEEILARIENNRCTLIVGETGCGKSTQVPKMCTRLFHGGRVLCTQPRRLAVVAVATRVAEELGVPLHGPDVGYSIGQDKQASSATEPALHFVTAGYLLQRLKSEGAKALSRLACLVLDEVHERSPENDLLVAFVRHLSPAHTRIVLMSASPNVQRLQTYFATGAERLFVVGLAHSAAIYNVQERYLMQALAEAEKDGAGPAATDAAALDAPDGLALLHPLITRLVCRLYLHQLAPGGTVLVFLPTWATLEEQHRALRRALPQRAAVHVLHSAIEMDECIDALALEGSSSRRVVLSSPIAESSVTIAAVSHVIDCCRTCEVYWSQRASDNLSHIVWVSKSQAMQRRGRTGRTCDGIVWRLVERETYAGFDEYETSTLTLQSQRKEVLLLTCSAEKLTRDAPAFLAACLDAPPPAAVSAAADKLVQMNMLATWKDRKGGGRRRGGAGRTRMGPTPYGTLADSLPIELPSAEFLIHSAVVGLLPEALTLAALANTTPLPIIRKPNENEAYERQMRRLGSAHVRGGERELLANFGAYLLWQRLLKDPQRWRRSLRELELSQYQTAQKALVEAAARAELSMREESEEGAWCAHQAFSRPALWAAYRLRDGLLGRLRRRNPPLYHAAIPSTPRRMDAERGSDDADLASRFLDEQTEPRVPPTALRAHPSPRARAHYTRTPTPCCCCDSDGARLRVIQLCTHCRTPRPLRYSHAHTRALASCAALGDDAPAAARGLPTRRHIISRRRPR
jgi:HrpA-like RNA helicase